MKFTVENFMGAERVALTVDGVVILAGRNHQGKSSTLRALASCVTGNTMPAGLPKNSGGQVVRVGTAKARAELVTDTGTAAIEWPKAERVTKDSPPHASLFAVGRSSLVFYKEADCAEALRSLLKADPIHDDLVTYLKERGVGDKGIERAWALVQRDGWDVAHTTVSDSMRNTKGQWSYCTGEAYGEKKAASWTPAGWDESLAGASEEALTAALTAARAELEAAIGDQAVSATEYTKIKTDADAYPARVSERDGAKKALDEAEAAAAAQRVKVEALPPTVKADGMPCPHCRKPVIIKRSEHNSVFLAIPEGENLSDEALKERRMAFATEDGKLANLNDRAGQARTAFNTADTALKIAGAAVKRMATLAQQSEADTAELDRKREAAKKAEADLAAFMKKREADRLHRNVMSAAVVAEALSPVGIRKTVMLRELKKFNDLIAEICGIAKWGVVTVTDDLGFELGGRPYALLSNSEQYRVRAALQVATAIIDGSDLTIMDDVDVLDSAGRGGLVTMLVRKKVRAVLGMMTTKPDGLPPLAAKKAGHVYWIEGGASTEVGAALSAAPSAAPSAAAVAA